jgi:hypothetical protein
MVTTGSAASTRREAARSPQPVQTVRHLAGDEAALQQGYVARAAESARVQAVFDPIVFEALGK